MSAPIALAHRLPRPVAYVLGGGGAWGAVQLGMLQALAGTDVAPDLVVGTSVGSLNGAVVAADPSAAVARLEGLWPSVTRSEVFPGGWLRGLRTLRESGAWIYDNEPLTGYMSDSIPATDFSELSIPLVAVATDFEAGTVAELDSGDLHSALLASCAIPGIYPWVMRDERRLVDGALVANVPIAVARRRGARSIVVLDCGRPGVESGDARTLAEVIGQSVAIYARRQIAADLRECADLPTVWITPRRPNRTSMLNLSATSELIEEGHACGVETLDQLTGTTPLPAGLHSGPAEIRADPSFADLIR